MLKPRKIPQRMCIGCQQMSPKKELIRLVRTPLGELIIDDSGKVSGRGAYLCPRTACLKAAIKGKRLQRALEINITEEVWVSLEEKIKSKELTLPQEEAQASVSVHANVTQVELTR